MLFTYSKQIEAITSYILILPILNPSENGFVESGASKFWIFFCLLSKLSLFLIIGAGLMHDSAQELYPNMGTNQRTDQRTTDRRSLL
jgi:hypothetical protein